MRAIRRGSGDCWRRWRKWSQQTPIVVVAVESQADRFVVIDGYERLPISPPQARTRRACGVDDGLGLVPSPVSDIGHFNQAPLGQSCQAPKEGRAAP